ncbi:MAG: ParA family protein [Nitrospirota bacterium]|nr:ParA family protein [Nitrospirota bacterium]
MAYIVGMVSQKGGAGKSTLAQLFARELAEGGFSVKIADLDTQQTSSAEWAADRADSELVPAIRCEAFANVKAAIAEAGNFDAYILDGKPNASDQTFEIARASHLVVIAVRQSKRDLRPAVKLANDLADNHGVDPSKIVFAMNQTTDSVADVNAARRWLENSDYNVLEGWIPLSTGYSTAMDAGKAITETSYKPLNKKAEKLAQAIIDKLAALSNTKEKGKANA